MTTMPEGESPPSDIPAEPALFAFPKTDNRVNPIEQIIFVFLQHFKSPIQICLAII